MAHHRIHIRKLKHTPSEFHHLQRQVTHPDPALPGDSRIQNGRLQIHKVPWIECAGVFESDGDGFIGVEDAEVKIGWGGLAEVPVVA